MTAPGLFETHKPEDCETHVARSIKGEIQKLWDRTVVHIKQAMEARRHPSGDYEPDFGERLRRLEGQLDDSEPRIRIERYDEGGGKHSWKDWILGLLGLLIVAWLARLDNKLDDVSDLKAQQKALDQHQALIDKHLESTDTRVDRVENKVYRGTP